MSSLPMLVESATSEVRSGSVDWGVNLEICDLVGSDPALAGELARLVLQRLKAKDVKVQQLALTLMETCVKNCDYAVHEAAGQRVFLDAVVALAEASPDQATHEHALALIQQWGVAFASMRDRLPLFYETYAALKVRGAQFREEDGASAPVFTPPATAELTGDAAIAAALANEDEAGGAPPEFLFAKMRRDLEVVSEKVALCREMMPNSPGVDHDEALSEVVGFLEACQPRLSEIIEAGARGELPADVFAAVLKVNEELTAALDAERAFPAPLGTKHP